MIPLLLLAALFFAGKLVILPWLSGWRRRPVEDRAFTVRFTLFTWILAVLFLAAFVFLPNKGRVLLMVPVFLAGGTLLKWWQAVRQRQRRKAEVQHGFAHARRVN